MQQLKNCSFITWEYHDYCFYYVHLSQQCSNRDSLEKIWLPYRPFSTGLRCKMNVLGHVYFLLSIFMCNLFIWYLFYFLLLMLFNHPIPNNIIVGYGAIPESELIPCRCCALYNCSWCKDFLCIGLCNLVAVLATVAVGRCWVPVGSHLFIVDL